MSCLLNVQFVAQIQDVDYNNISTHRISSTTKSPKVSFNNSIIKVRDKLRVLEGRMMGLY